MSPTAAAATDSMEPCAKHQSPTKSTVIPAASDKLTCSNPTDTTIDTTMSMEEALKVGKQLASSGFTALKQGSHNTAVNHFSQALDLMVPHVGQMSAALGPIYLAYGRALMQVAVEGMDGLLLVKGAKVPEQKEEEAKDDGDDRGKGKIIDLPDIYEASEEEDQEEEGDESPQEESSVEDDFQLAWEVLDTARLIYANQPATNLQARRILSDIHVDLGDLQMENEQFSGAISDFRKALDILDGFNDEGGNKSIEDEVEGQRARASVWFKVAMAHEYAGELKEAVEPLTTALALLRSANVPDLVSELELKLADIQAALDKAVMMKSKIIDDCDGSAAGFKSVAADVAVNDLSTLVKKRKAPAGEESVDHMISKQARTE